MTDAQAERKETQANRRWNFTWATLTGIFFQGGVAFIDTGTVIAAFVSHLTAAAVAVGAAEVIARFGWLGPQLFAAHYVRSRPHRKPIYLLGGGGRAFFLGVLGVLLLLQWSLAPGILLLLFFVLWTLYAFIGGLAGVPYNDIIGRTIPSDQRSRLLAWRFLGGGVLAVGAGLIVAQILGHPALAFPADYGLIFALAAIVLAFSTLCFAQMREPPAPVEREQTGFRAFLAEGWAVARRDRRFRLFLVSQWLAGLTAMAIPLYILQARQHGLTGSAVGTLLTVQMVGSLVVNPLWGWWGDRRGKLSLLSLLALVSLISPGLALLLGGQENLVGYGAVFFFLGAVASGGIIADLGYLMEISPDARRPEYTGYMNALVVPARTFPLLAAGLVDLIGFTPVFAIAVVGGMARLVALYKLRQVDAQELQ